MKELNLTINVNDANVILRALSTMPYNQVHELIQKLQSQARVQLNEGNGTTRELQNEHSNN